MAGIIIVTSQYSKNYCTQCTLVIWFINKLAPYCQQNFSVQYDTKTHSIHLEADEKAPLSTFCIFPSPADVCNSVVLCQSRIPCKLSPCVTTCSSVINNLLFVQFESHRRIGLRSRIKNSMSLIHKKLSQVQVYGSS